MAEPIRPIRRLVEARLDIAWKDDPGQNYASKSKRSEGLYSAVSSLLAGWPLEDIEEAAWEFALVGWQEPPPLVRDNDEAFRLFLEVLRENRPAGDQHGGMEGLSVLFDEFRNRVQFIQTRGADIRLSLRLEDLTRASAERLLPVLEDLKLKLIAVPEAQRAAELQRFEQQGRAGLLAAVALQVGRQHPALGAAVEPSLTKLTEAARSLVTAVGSGVAGNAAYDWLKQIAG